MSKTDLNTSKVVTGSRTLTVICKNAKYACTPSSTTTNAPVSTDTVKREGTVNPNYIQKMSGKHGPLNECTFKFDKTSIKHWQGHSIDRRSIVYDNVTIGQLNGIGGFTTSVAPTLSPTAALIAEAQNKLLLKLKDQQVNLAQAFAERGQTADLLSSTARRLYNMFKAIKRADMSAAAQAIDVTLSKRKRNSLNSRLRKHKGTNEREYSKALADATLALDFGWKPLLSDVYESFELTQNRLFTELYSMSRASVHREYETKVVTTNTGTRRVIHIKEVIDVKARAVFAIENDVSHAMSKVGLSNPALIAWELTPWSFVIDWFLPVGNYISSMDATLGLIYRTGGTTTFIRKTMNSEASSLVPGIEIRAKESIETIQMRRNLVLSFPHASFPRFKNPLSFQHAVDAIALLRQLKS